jgi:hypothetical protein
MAYEGAVKYPIGWTILFTSFFFFLINQSSVINTMERTNVLLSKCSKYVSGGEKQKGAV